MKKFFVIAHVEKGKDTTVEWWQLKHIRPFIDLKVNLTSDQGVTETILQSLPNKAEMANAIMRLVVNYPRELETMIDEKSHPHERRRHIRVLPGQTTAIWFTSTSTQRQGNQFNELNGAFG